MKRFTLLELIIVLAVFGILMSMLLPSLRKSKEHTKMVVCLSNQGKVAKRIFMYAKDRNFEIPPYYRISLDHWRFKMPTGHNTRSFMVGGNWKFSRRNLSYLWETRKELHEDQAMAKMLYCPVQQNESFKFESYSEPVFPTPNSLVPNQAKRVRGGYNYNILRQEDSMLPRYERTLMFENETILLTDLFTQAKGGFLSNNDIVSHHKIDSFGYTKGDGSSRVKKSKTFIQTIRSRDWKRFTDLNYMGELLQ